MSFVEDFHFTDPVEGLRLLTSYEALRKNQP